MALGKPCIGVGDGLETYNSQGPVHQVLHLIENGNAKMTTIIGVFEVKAGSEAERLVVPNGTSLQLIFLHRSTAQHHEDSMMQQEEKFTPRRMVS